MLRKVILLPIALAAVTLAACTPSDTLITPDLMTHCGGEPAPTGDLRVVSYNMHGGVASSLEAVGDVLEELDADVVLLQEVDRGVGRSGEVDQDEALAERLGYHSAFAAGRRRENGDFGVAILSRFPFTRVDRIELSAPLSSQPRTALDASICVGEQEVRVVAVHSDVFAWATQVAVRRLAEAVEGSVGQGLIIGGDFNVGPEAVALEPFRRSGLADLLSDALPDAVTHPGLPGLERLDYIFTDALFTERTLGSGVIETPVSDHYPIYSDFSMSGW